MKIVKRLPFTFVVVVILFAVSGIFGRHNFLAKNHNVVLDNGDQVTFKGEQVSIYDTKGELRQQSTFAKPTFIAAKGFLLEMQMDLKNKHYTDFLQGDIHYPLRVNQRGKKPLMYQNAQQLLPHFNQVFTAHIISQILKQNPYRLFAHSNGIMIGNGEVWFDDKGIFVINL